MSVRKLVLVAAIAVAPACGEVAASRDVTCSSPSTAFLPNGSFDDPMPLWKQEVTGGASTPSLLCGSDITPADGIEAACMGGMDGQIQSLSQTVQLPDGAKSVTLNGKICITTEETDPVDNDTLKVELLDGTTTIATLGQFSNQNGVAQDCQFTAFTPLAGTLTSDPPEATLRLRSTLNTLKTTSFFIDALKLDVTCAAQ